MTSFVAPARSVAIREDLPTPASPQIRSDVARLGERRGDRRAVLRPADVGHCHRPGHRVILP